MISPIETTRDTGDAHMVTVHGSPRRFAQEIVVRQHRLASDEPTSDGGTDTGPNPYDLLLAALGSCTSMTVALYARRKGWPLEAVTVRLQLPHIHAVDAASCDNYSALVGDIDRHIELVGDLDETQRARLLEIADKCPVHRTLRSNVHIQTRATVWARCF